jgi:D-inositol-3-phosphate glycosyltransferase
MPRLSQIGPATKTLRRIAMVSLHTSPLDQPGTGDAGGMNVYVDQVARQLARRGVEVDIFTRATSSAQPDVVRPVDGVTVRHVPAGPFEGLGKDDLPAQLCSFARGLLRAEASKAPGYYDLLHTHYWLSGQVGALAAERWNVPLVHTMHTMAKVKNLALADGESPEPAARELGEEQVVESASALVANTETEARELVHLYGADPRRVEIVYPGVDLSAFAPVDESERRRLRSAAGIPVDARLVLFAGRFQPHKAPDLLIRALGRAVADGLLDPGPVAGAGPVVAVFVGGPSGSASFSRDDLLSLAASAGIAELVRTEPPAAHADLARWFATADLVVVPSYSESFGLVAVEAQATGAPVLAAAVGGLPVAVANGQSGLLVPSHRVDDWAHALADALGDRERLASWRSRAVEHAARFTWSRTADQLVEVYEGVLAQNPELARHAG